MDFLENFKSRFQSYYKARDGLTTTSRVQETENIKTSRKCTRAKMLEDRRHIETRSNTSPGPQTKKLNAKPEQKLDRLTRMKLWRTERDKKNQEKKEGMKPIFQVSARRISTFPAVQQIVQKHQKSFAPKDHVFKAPINVKPISGFTKTVIAVTNYGLQRVTRSQKPLASTLLSLAVGTRKNTNSTGNKKPSTAKGKNLLIRQDAIEDQSSIIVNSETLENKDNFSGRLQKTTKDISKRRKPLQDNIKSDKTENSLVENQSNPVATTSKEQISLKKLTPQKRQKPIIANSKTEENKENFSARIQKTSKHIPKRKKSLQNNIKSDKIENILLENQSNPVATTSKEQISLNKLTPQKRRSLRIRLSEKSSASSTENLNIMPELILSEETVKISPMEVPAKRKSLRKTPNKRQSRGKLLRKSTSNEECVKTSSFDDTTIQVSNTTNTTPENTGRVPAYISPFVTTSRGKGSIKKENKERSIRGLPLFTEYNTPDKLANTSFQATGAAYYHTVLRNEIFRLTARCDTWNKYKDDSNNLSEDTIEMIDVAVGQANLLMNKKFKQFENLIISCENGCGEVKPVTCEDLQGFWDMIYIQVENLNVRFNRLAEMKANNWEEIAPVVQRKKQLVKKINSKPIKSTGTSSLRAAIQAARKKNQSELPDNVFNGGFFLVKSPRKNSPVVTTKRTPSTRARRSLLASVLSTETEKRARKSVGSPGVAMMKASQIAKSVENLNLPTPGKSILKTRKNRKSCAMNVSKVVLFKDYHSNEEDS